MAAEIYVVRHGETEWSLAGKHTSRTDLSLTEEGRRRAALLAGLLGGHSFALVLSSPLRRARETCALAGFGEAAVIDDDLREWDYGEYEGLTTPEIWAERIGIGVANAINTFDPEEVVIGGGGAQAGELLLEPASRVARGYVHPGLGRSTTIRLARHGVRAGVLGAALLAEHELEAAAPAARRSSQPRTTEVSR